MSDNYYLWPDGSYHYLPPKAEDLWGMCRHLTAERDKLKDALETMIVGACAVGVPHTGEREVLIEAVGIARAALQEVSNEHYSKRIDGTYLSRRAA